MMRPLAALCIGASCLLFTLEAMPHEPDAEEVALGSLVDAELAFARMGRERGVHAAFLANFAADGVALEPAPVRVQQAFRERAAPADPLALRLDWKPAQAGVARSHDFGYTTGPYTLSSAANPQTRREGAFFSVWQRSPAGRWEVILDAGIGTAGTVDFVALGAAPRPGYAGPARPAAARRDLLAQETSGFGAAGAALTPNGYARLLADDARLHRNGAAPIASRGAIARATAQRIQRVTWTPIDARVARSADMALTWGRYRETDRAAHEQDGYYAHLWLRDRAGRWRLAYDVALPRS
ncbi:MAG TPA: nuclear transport factor 2 family protein [Casimicrobiaceae bacterium]|nr:nuclear transport factor 2 family protein [Casimicrobiaceae bacterium]